MSDCPVCTSGLVEYVVPETEEALEHKRMAACLCAAGQAKLAVVKSIAVCLPVERIEELWPEGVPKLELLSARLRDSEVPAAYWSWTLKTYRTKFGKKSKTIQGYVELADEWIKTPRDQRTDVVLFGPNGTGKTGLAVSMLHACLEQRETGLFTETKRLMMRWRDTFRADSDQSELGILDMLELPHVLVLDEWGGEGLSEFVEKALTLTIDRRQKAQVPTIITLNLAADSQDVATEELVEMFGPSLSDRLREKAQFWPIWGKSRRSTLSRVLPFAPKE